MSVSAIISMQCHPRSYLTTFSQDAFLVQAVSSMLPCLTTEQTCCRDRYSNSVLISLNNRAFVKRGVEDVHLATPRIGDRGMANDLQITSAWFAPVPQSSMVLSSIHEDQGDTTRSPRPSS